MVDGREIVVDDVLHIADVNTTGRHAGGDEDGGNAGAEGSHGSLPLLLGAIRVHGSAREAFMEEEVVQLVSHAFIVDEDDGPARLQRAQEVLNGLALQIRLDVDDFLLDVCMSATGAANAETDVVLGEMGLR